MNLIMLNGRRTGLLGKRKLIYTVAQADGMRINPWCNRLASFQDVPDTTEFRRAMGVEGWVLCCLRKS